MITTMNNENIKSVQAKNDPSTNITLKTNDVASVLIHALPYIQKFYGKTVVIKYGGNAMVDEHLKTCVMRDIALMKFVGIKPVIVHGGGPDITEYLKKCGKETQFVNGLRVTDEETVAIAEMVLVGKVNTAIVSLLSQQGVKAVGISGKDADLLIARKKMVEVKEPGQASKTVDIGFVGEVTAVNTSYINDLLEKDYIPVIAPIGTDAVGHTYNINADYVAAEVAGALQAEKLLLLTDTKGIYKDFNNPSSFLSTVKEEEAQALIANGGISGGMIPKVESALRALAAGTNRVTILDGRDAHSLLLELFTPQGIGTEIIS